ncbi:IS3 family transposase, partial [Baekduia sp.]
VFYNRERRHSRLGQLSPVQYEKMITEDLQEHQAA